MTSETGKQVDRHEDVVILTGLEEIKKWGVFAGTEMEEILDRTIDDFRKHCFAW